MICKHCHGSGTEPAKRKALRKVSPKKARDNSVWGKVTKRRAAAFHNRCEICERCLPLHGHLRCRRLRAGKTPTKTAACCALTAIVAFIANRKSLMRTGFCCPAIGTSALCQKSIKEFSNQKENGNERSEA